MHKSLSQEDTSHSTSTIAQRIFRIFLELPPETLVHFLLHILNQEKYSSSPQHWWISVFFSFQFMIIIGSWDWLGWLVQNLVLMVPNLEQHLNNGSIIGMCDLISVMTPFHYNTFMYVSPGLLRGLLSYSRSMITLAVYATQHHQEPTEWAVSALGAASE